MNLSPEQHAAIYTHDRNLIVVAGAGSGKTYVLVNRYLALLDNNRDWPLNALVAITFTRKAAQEMRDRVRQELEKRHFAAQSSDERDSWAARIAGMESARIDTIHGLCASILRANAAEVGIDPGFQVLDEVEARRLLDDVIDDVLRVIVLERDPSIRLFMEYDVNAVRDGLVRLIGAKWNALPEDPYAQWERDAAAYLSSLIHNPAYRNAADWIPPNGWPEDEQDNLVTVWRKCWDAIVTLDRGGDLSGCLDALRTLQTSIKLTGGSAKVWGSKEIRDEAKEALKILREAAQTALDELSDPQIERKAAELLPLWNRLLHRAQDAYIAAKQQDHLLDFDDLERQTRDLLQRYPQVRARYQGSEFKHLLVDEFQDTNATQWDILRMLADPVQPGSLFVVGDAKQSIYQFRGADVSVFDQVRQVIISAGGVDISLVRSFRSHKRLVDGFNHLFAEVLARDHFSPASQYETELGEPMMAFREQSPADAPCLELLLLDKGILKGEEDSTEKCRRWEAYEIARYLRELKEVEQRQVYDKERSAHRSIDYGDMALLFQSTSNITIYEDVFKAMNLPFVTVAGRGYYSRQEVWDLLNLLTALHNPADDLRLASALRSPLFNLSDDALLALRLCTDQDGKRLSLWDALGAVTEVPQDEVAQVEFARDCLYQLRGLAGRVTISELLREALACTGYLATLTALPDGARRRGNVEKLLEKAQTSGHVTLGAFQQYIRDLSGREVREGEALVDVKGAVTLMTVHASKGLEYPLVVLVDASWERGNTGSPAVMVSPQHGLTCKVYDPQSDKLVGSYAHRQAEKIQALREEAERKRLFYVAATRAQDYLLVSGQMSYHKTNDCWRAEGWLGLLWDAIPLHNFVPQPGKTTFDYGVNQQMTIIVPERPPADEAITAQAADRQSIWDHPSVQNSEPLPGYAVEPPLIRPVRVTSRDIARHLSATQIADLGGAEYDLRHGEKFRRSLLHDTPTPIEDIHTLKQRVSGRIIGEMVHKVLSFPTQSGNLDKILESYAWEQGVVDDRLRLEAVREARSLLQRTLNSDVYRWMQEAEASGRKVYRELPFVFKNDGHTMHGIIDVLFQWGEGSWAIVDYKTSYVPGYTPGNLRSIREHARRYHLQVGVYAEAVREQLGGITPDVYIHYIRYAETIQVYAGEWELALGKMEGYIGNLLDESDWVS